VTASVDILRSIDEIDPGSWDAVAGAAFARSHGFLSALEHTRLQERETRYFVYRGPDGAVAAHGYFYEIGVPLELVLPRHHPAARLIARARRWRPAFLEPRVVGCGPLTSLGSALSFSPSLAPDERAQAVHRLVDAMRAFARERGAGGIVLRDLRREDAGVARALAREGFARVPNLEDTALRIRWRSWDEYLAALKGRYRRLVLEDLRQAEAAGVRPERAAGWAPHAEEMARLFDQTAARHTALPGPGADYFRRLSALGGGRIRTTLFWLERRLVAFIMSFRSEGALTATYLGADSALNERVPLVFNALYDAVQAGIESGLPLLRLGRTAYVAKMRLGAELEPLDLFVQLRSRALTRLVGALAPGLVPRQRQASWKVFKRTSKEVKHGIAGTIQGRPVPRVAPLPGAHAGDGGPQRPVGADRRRSRL